jgi:hypothetical protein
LLTLTPGVGHSSVLTAPTRSRSKSGIVAIVAAGGGGGHGMFLVMTKWGPLTMAHAPPMVVAFPQ